MVGPLAAAPHPARPFPLPPARPFPLQQTLLASEDIAKVGVNITGDAHKLHADFGVRVAACCELGTEANRWVLGAAWRAGPPPPPHTLARCSCPPSWQPLLPTPADESWWMSRTSRQGWRSSAGAWQVQCWTILARHSRSTQRSRQLALFAGDSGLPGVPAALLPTGAPAVGIRQPASSHQLAGPWRCAVAGLCAEVLRLLMQKEDTPRLSNWELNPLLPQQRHYAACDAYASLALQWAIQVRPQSPWAGTAHHGASLLPAWAEGCSPAGQLHTCFQNAPALPGRRGVRCATRRQAAAESRGPASAWLLPCRCCPCGPPPPTWRSPMPPRRAQRRRRPACATFLPCDGRLCVLQCLPLIPCRALRLAAV